jgi:hypothetical protein
MGGIAAADAVLLQIETIPQALSVKESRGRSADVVFTNHKPWSEQWLKWIWIRLSGLWQRRRARP